MNLFAMMYMSLLAMKGKFLAMKNDERGGAEIIAVVVLVAIVVVLGIAFKDKIVRIIQDIFSSINPESVGEEVHID